MALPAESAGPARLVSQGILVLACLAAATGLTACTDLDEPAAPTSSTAVVDDASSAPVRTLDAASSTACDRARATILARTETFTQQFEAISRAEDQADAAARDQGFAALRQGLTAWATDLDAQAGDAPVNVRSMLRQYAGAVRAALRRAPTVAQLDELYTFSETELDVAADQFARTC